MNEQERFAYLQLALSENVGPITFWDLLCYYKTPSEALKHLPDLAQRGGKKKIQIADKKSVELQLQKIKECDGQILYRTDSDFPALLKQLPDCPMLLFVRGTPSLLKTKCLSVVGTRRCSVNGKNLTRKMAFNLSVKGYTIVSGLAEGIDTCAHEGALANTAGTGNTIAVVGTDVGTCYPAANQELFNSIVERGCVISEFPFGSVLGKWNFISRNRIISGLSLGIVVIEAQFGSGSLNTAKNALEQGREVFAVPGSPADPRSEGPNHLIQKGAVLVTSAEDVHHALTDLQPAFELQEKQTQPDFPAMHIDEDQLQSARDIILNALSAEQTNIDFLIQETGLPINAVHIVLSELELAGRITRASGNQVSLLFKEEE